jgi:SpoVK/Ycf46/Vps4 family AAA+-type ATPase
VQHGVDRYANLEVSYLLQRIEDYAGLVILASNLRDNIDSAFTRRFHVVIQFPRPQPKERQRIWEIAFPSDASLEGGLDLDLLARLDLTGANITGTTRTAALLTAADGCDAIGKSHIVHAIARQYKSEARVLLPAQLGAYAGFLQEVK